MSVLIVTSLGDIVIDLYSDKCPLTSKNFLKLCKMKYYNGCLFHTVQKDFTAQTGDPTGSGSGGDSVYKFLYGEQARFFSDEIHLDLKHTKTGTVAMASAGENLNASQFYFTLRDELDYLDGKHTVFGEIAEGLETLTRINEAYVDEKGRPYKNIRIKHTYILDDPFEDPPQLTEFIPDASPEGKPKDELEEEARLEDDWVPLDEQIGVQELEEVIRSKEAHSRAVVLETIGDIPDAEIKPPDNVLFVCKLNPVTEDEDLNTIFSRFGTVVSAEVIRDFKTGDSLCYAFIEFETNESCEQAYFKMDNALIDDRRIHVDFSQSVSKLWSQYRRNDHKTGQGRGCFKCGETDHIAKDCTSGGVPAANRQEQKYVVKDNNRQRGGRENSRYDMVFDEDTPESPKREKKHRGHDSQERAEKQKANREEEKRDSRDRHGLRTEREYGDRRERDGRSGGSRSGRDYPDDRSRESHKERGNSQNDDMINGRDHRRRDDRNSRDNERLGDKREGEVYRRDHRKRNTDDDYQARNGRDGDMRRKQSNDGDERKEKREERDRKRDGEDYRRDHKKRSTDKDYQARDGERDRKRREADGGDEQNRERRHRYDDRRK